MTKQQSYIKLVCTDYGYEIYAINKGQKSKLSKRDRIIMTRVLKKFTSIKKENTYISNSSSCTSNSKYFNTRWNSGCYYKCHYNHKKYFML